MAVGEGDAEHGTRQHLGYGTYDFYWFFFGHSAISCCCLLLPLGPSKINLRKRRWTIPPEPVKSGNCMKSNLLRSVLEWALITSLLLSVYFFVNYYFKSKQQRLYQGEVRVYQTRHQRLQVLVNEAAAYSQRDPSILPILEIVGAKPVRTNAPAAAKPATK